MKWLKRLFHKHEFKHTDTYCLDKNSRNPGVEVARGYSCECGKTDFRFVVGGRAMLTRDIKIEVA